MNFDDIKSRIERMHIALKSSFEDDFKKHLKTEFHGEATSITFPARDSKLEIENKVMALIHITASLKDHLKAAMKKKGHAPERIEYAINNCIPLQVLIDLDNMDKHSTTLKGYRYGKRTELRNIHQTVVNANKGQPVIMTIGTRGEIETAHGRPPVIKILAEIFDENETYLFSLDTMIERSYSIWLSLAYRYKLLD